MNVNIALQCRDYYFWPIRYLKSISVSPGCPAGCQLKCAARLSLSDCEYCQEFSTWNAIDHFKWIWGEFYCRTGGINCVCGPGPLLLSAACCLLSAACCLLSTWKKDNQHVPFHIALSCSPRPDMSDTSELDSQQRNSVFVGCISVLWRVAVVSSAILIKLERSCEQSSTGFYTTYRVSLLSFPTWFLVFLTP